MSSPLSFQAIILKLQNYWAEYGCAILQPYDMEMGAGTFHPATVLRTISEPKWNVAFVQPCRRPTDSRYGKHPNRMQHYYQFQVILKPSPDDIQDLYLESLVQLGINIKEHDIRFVEDDWESPTLGAAGLGWEIWCDGMEVSQFTYMQQIAGIECHPVAGEITYGLERLALYIQQKQTVADLDWNDRGLTYGAIEFAAEEQFSKFNLELADTSLLRKSLDDYEIQVSKLIEHNLPIVAYDYCIKASHAFNLLDTRGQVHVNARESEIGRIRNLAQKCCHKWLEMNKE